MPLAKETPRKLCRSNLGSLKSVNGSVGWETRGLELISLHQISRKKKVEPLWFVASCHWAKLFLVHACYSIWLFVRLKKRQSMEIPTLDYILNFGKVGRRNRYLEVGEDILSYNLGVSHTTSLHPSRTMPWYAKAFLADWGFINSMEAYWRSRGPRTSLGRARPVKTAWPRLQRMIVLLICPQSPKKLSRRLIVIVDCNCTHRVIELIRNCHEGLKLWHTDIANIHKVKVISLGFVTLNFLFLDLFLLRLSSLSEFGVSAIGS